MERPDLEALCRLRPDDGQPFHNPLMEGWPTVRTRASCNDCDDASRLVVESSMKHERMICSKRWPRSPCLSYRPGPVTPLRNSLGSPCLPPLHGMTIL